jgi:exodeoxyribonuclease-3|tara:strand:- start:620 stop:1426 length:807 start_codon:yes stop_codon:yes gene_type:complete
MKLTTWNINSVRLRLPLLAKLIKTVSPDVICLQETKVPDDLFPKSDIQSLGYPHVFYRGMKGYNGVAILSRLPLSKKMSLDWCGRKDCRHLSAKLPNGVELHNFYVPSGGDVPNPKENDKFAHKLRFLDEITDWFQTSRTPQQGMILVGDLNIAPLETDVWSHKQLLKVVSHTPVEVEKLQAVQGAVESVDAVRQYIPESESLYAWWSYRARDWSKSDRGRRLDHIWVTPPLAEQIKSVAVLRNVRGWDRASDHVPVILELGVDGQAS